MDVFVADDSGQPNPSRSGMGPLVAVGGLHVPGDSVGPLERALDELCASAGFPGGEEFKWSPKPKMWMHKNLVGEDRARLFAEAMALARDHGATAIVVAVDRGKRPAVAGVETPEHNAVTMLLERADNLLRGRQSQAVFICDRPDKGRKGDDEFLAQCLETLRAGTAFVTFERIALAMTTDSRFARLVQLADVTTSCTVAYIAGESRYAPAIFEHVRPIVREEAGRAGGVGVKIHPDGRYANLYHWLLGDTHQVKRGRRRTLPTRNMAYAASSESP